MQVVTCFHGRRRRHRSLPCARSKADCPSSRPVALRDGPDLGRSGATEPAFLSDFRGLVSWWPATILHGSLAPEPPHCSEPDSSPPMLPLLTLVFVVSGATGLIYESIWSRYLNLLVGHSAYAQIIVLVIFLGGMSLGALLVGKRSERLRQPLLTYAGVEAAVGVIGLLFNYAYIDISNLAYDRIFPALAGGWLLVVVKWLLAAIMILPQSILLGMTSPLMSAGAIRLVRSQSGRMLGLLYFANSLGAAIGVLLAGFVLLQRVGLPGTLVAAAIFNFVAAPAIVIGTRIPAFATTG